MRWLIRWLVRYVSFFFEASALIVVIGLLAEADTRPEFIFWGVLLLVGIVIVFRPRKWLMRGLGRGLEKKGPTAHG